MVLASSAHPRVVVAKAIVAAFIPIAQLLTGHARSADFDSWRHCMQTSLPGLSIKSCGAIISGNEIPQNAALAYLYRARAYARCEQRPAARTDFEAATKADPTLGQAHLGLALIDDQENMGSAAEKEFEVALASTGEDVALSDFKAQVLIERGIVHMNRGKSASALLDFSTAASQCTDCATARANTAWALSAQKRYDEALDAIAKALPMNPRRPGSFTARGIVYSQMAKWQLAEENFAEAIRLNPEDPISYQNRALAYAHLGQTKLANADRTTESDLKQSLAKKRKAICDPNNTAPYNDAFDDGVLPSQIAKATGVPADQLKELFSGKRWTARQGLWNVDAEFRADGSFSQRMTTAAQQNPITAMVDGAWYVNRGELCIDTSARVCVVGHLDGSRVTLSRYDGSTEYDGEVGAFSPITLDSASAPVTEVRLDELFVKAPPSSPQSKTLLYFIGGYGGNDRPSRVHSAVPRPFVQGLQQQNGWDIIDAIFPTEGQQNTMSAAQSRPYGAAAFVARRLKELKAQGYDRIFVGGQSTGGWTTLILSSQSDLPLDGTILLVPACCGTRLNKGTDVANRNFVTNKTAFDDLITRDRYPTVAIFFLEDEYEPEDRTAKTEAALTANNVRHVIISDPPGFKGHGSGWLPVFDFAFRDCISRFLNGEKVDHCDIPPLSDTDFRTVFNRDKIADFDKLLATPNDVIGKTFLTYKNGNRIQVKDNDTTELTGDTFGDRIVPSHFENGSLCLTARALFQQPAFTDQVCRKVVKWSNGDLLLVNDKTGAVDQWWYAVH